MSAQYTEDPNGVVHIIDQSGDGEFTLCGLEQGCGNMDFDRDGLPAFGNHGEFEGEYSNGPASCQDCRMQFDKFKQTVSGAKWHKKLASSNWKAPTT